MWAFRVLSVRFVCLADRLGLPHAVIFNGHCGILTKGEVLEIMVNVERRGLEDKRSKGSGLSDLMTVYIAKDFWLGDHYCGSEILVPFSYKR